MAHLGCRPRKRAGYRFLDAKSRYRHHVSYTPPRHRTLPTRRSPRRQNIQPRLPNTIPDYILPAHHKPKHHKPDLIHAVGYIVNAQGKLLKDLTYREQRQKQIIECKYSTDGNIQDIMDHIYNIYEPLRLALQIHGTLKSEVKIIPTVISRTDTFHVKTHAEIAQLVSFKQEPLDVLTLKQLPITSKNVMTLHVHAQEWLSYIQKPLEKTSLQNKRRLLPLNTRYIKNSTEDITNLGCERRGGE